jgi:hypothetical protein
MMPGKRDGKNRQRDMAEPRDVAIVYIYAVMITAALSICFTSEFLPYGKALPYNFGLGMIAATAMAYGWYWKERKLPDQTHILSLLSGLFVPAFFINETEIELSGYVSIYALTLIIAFGVFLLTDPDTWLGRRR